MLMVYTDSLQREVNTKRVVLLHSTILWLEHCVSSEHES